MLAGNGNASRGNDRLACRDRWRVDVALVVSLAHLFALVLDVEVSPKRCPDDFGFGRSLFECRQAKCFYLIRVEGKGFTVKTASADSSFSAARAPWVVLGVFLLKAHSRSVEKA